jgi:5'-deoxynucleotidase YfbR-like HD superfamily hydrolase
MPTMLTIGGRTVSLLAPAVDDVDIDDIAHHLTQINRFLGACRRPYSVAEHSLVVLEIFQREYPDGGPCAQLAALTHDAHEAYTGDMISPWKQALRILCGDVWDLVEARHASAVDRRFHLVATRAAWRTAIKRCDDIAYATERQQLTPQPADRIDDAKEPPAAWLDLAHGRDTNWAQLFRARFGALTDARRVAGVL